MRKQICPQDPTSGISMDELKQGITMWERSLHVKVSEREKINRDIAKLEGEIKMLKADLEFRDKFLDKYLQE